MKLQEFDFDIAHIPGKENPADAMSRLFLLTKLDFEQEVLENIIYWGDYEGHQEYLAELPVNWEEINPVIDEYYKAVNDEDDLILRHYLEYLLLENEEKPRTPEEISKIINEFHNTHTGHHGINSTIRMLKRKGFEWPNMKEHIKNHIERCATCQKIRLRHSNTETSLTPRSASYPYEQLEMDYIGPFPEDDFGNTYILVIIDCFTRYTELVATKNANAYCTASAILSICGRYGTPKVIRSDKGTHFLNSVIDSLMTFLHIKQTFGIANAPMVQGIVERANQEVIKHLQAICMEWDINSTWSTYLPLVQRIINLSFHSEIDTYPQRLLYGDAFAENIGLTVVSSNKDTKNDYVEKLNNTLKTIIQASINHQAKKADTRKSNLLSGARNTPPTEFLPGQYVLIEYVNQRLSSNLLSFTRTGKDPGSY